MCYSAMLEAVMAYMMLLKEIEDEKISRYIYVYLYLSIYIHLLTLATIFCDSEQLGVSKRVCGLEDQ